MIIKDNRRYNGGDWLYKVTPIDRVIHDSKRRADDYWWEGDDDEARLEEAYIKLYEQDREEGIEWVPNFQITQFLLCLQQLTRWASCSQFIFMQESEVDDAEDKNAPFDDVTHWVGNLPRKDTDSTKRTTKRNTRRETKSNFLRKKLGLEKK